MSNVVKSESDYSLAKPERALALADELKRFVEDRKLFTLIQGGKYVNVEGWQFAGGMLGLFPVLVSCDDISTDQHIRYRATVDLIDQSGMLRGRGMAMCSSAERTKRNFDEYAIASMAQTRAVGKAYRMLLAWVLKAAGYEPTPAEEMPDDAHTTPQSNERPEPTPTPAPVEKTPENRPTLLYRGSETVIPVGKSRGRKFSDLRVDELESIRDGARATGKYNDLVECIETYLSEAPSFLTDGAI